MYGPLSCQLARALTEERLATAESIAAHRYSLPVVEEILPAWRASSPQPRGPVSIPTRTSHASSHQALR
jgi:hypothetical protein